MKKIWKIIIIVSLGVLLLLGGLAYWQKDNIKALWIAANYSIDEIEKQRGTQDADLKKQLESYFSDGMRDFTPEEEEQIEKGEATKQQILAKIVAEAANKTSYAIPDTTAEQPALTAPNASKNETTSAPLTNVAGSDIVSKYMVQIYALEGQYIGKIEGLISSAIAEYKAGGGGGKSAKISIAAGYVGRATALEQECDAQLAATLSNMKAELTAVGADTSIIGTIQSAYASEKASMRAYYISKYGK